MTFEEYLRRNSYPNKKVSDHLLRVTIRKNGQVSFYIHPEGVGGDTKDYVVAGNALAPDPNVVEG